MPGRNSSRAGMLSRSWPWLLLALALVPAVAHFVSFEQDLDGEYPQVVRPTFSPRPPAAYRLAEPGDTIDRVALYVSAAGAVVAAMSWITGGRARLWPSALAIDLAAGWFASTPGPCYDGWHGLGFRVIANSSAPWPVRAGIASLALCLAAVVVANWLGNLRVAADFVRDRDRRGTLALFLASAVLIALRFAGLPPIEPLGYWPRWCLVWGLMAFGFGLVQLAPASPPGGKRWAVRGVAALALWGLIAGGIALSWYHRPLERLRAVVPGRIYISAMPTHRGLAIEQERLHFKTVINLFPEETLQRSPHLEGEMQFLRERGIRFIRSPGTAIDSDEFLDLTLRLARDPSAWPILVHCHGCMDRSPAWMGIYRFVVQGVPLADVMREIEGHRGCRPKASVTLLYNRVLAPRSPQRYAADPTARLLVDCARGTLNPYDLLPKDRLAGPNLPAEAGVSRR